MKIRRRKKNGHEVGNCFVVVDRKWVNLGTKNQVTARKRAAAYLRGEWPEENANAVAADVAAAAEQVPDLPDQQGAEGAEVEGPGSGAANAESDPGPDCVEAEVVDPAAVAAEAAKETAGGSEGQGASGDEDAEARWQARCREFFTEASGGGKTSGETIAAATVAGVGKLVDMLGQMAKPPLRVTWLPMEGDPMLRLLGLAWDEQMARWSLDLARLKPIHVMIGVPIAVLAGTALSLREEKDEPAAGAAS